MGEDVYVELRKFLDGLPGGFPETPTGVELKILEKWFTPEEAEMAVRLRQFPEPASVIAERCGMTGAETEEMLDTMARKGLIFSIESGGMTFYMAMHFVIGIYEFHVDSIDREASELLEEYMESFRGNLESIRRTGPRQLRVVPVASALDTTPSVASYNQVRNLVNDHELAAVAPCICRREKGLLGQECEKPNETCLMLGLAAQYYIRTGKGREISIDEVFDIIDRAEENALVLMPTNSKDIINICCCCGCCCGVFRLLRMEDRPADHVYSGYQAKIDAALCNACGTCVERCQMSAIIENENAAEIDLARCIGCGLCVPTCEQNAASLVARPGVGPIPANNLEMSSSIARDRGLGFGRLTPMMRMTKVPLMIKSLPYLYRSGLGKPLVNFMAGRGWI